MNKIEEQIKKFEKMKQKIPNIDISNLIKVKKQFSNSLLNYLIQKKSNCSPKKQTNDIFTSNHPITENPTEQRQKEKNKFITQKADEKGKSTKAEIQAWDREMEIIMIKDRIIKEMQIKIWNLL